MLGLSPVHASKGVMWPERAECGLRARYTAAPTLNGQNSGPTFAPIRVFSASSHIDRFSRSAAPLDSGLYGTVVR